MDPILDISKKYGLMIIEDAAEAHGGEYFSKINKSWRKCGSFGHLACFSFYANKIVTSGEGGMVLTSDKKLAERLRRHRNLCFLNSPRFLHHEIGSNFRMTNIQAAVGLAQLEYIDKTIRRKVGMAKQYSKALEGPPLQLPIEREWAKNVIWMYAVLLKENKSTRSYFEKDWSTLSPDHYAKWPSYRIMDKLSQKGIETRPFFIGMHEQPVFRKQGFFKNESYPVTERIARTGFYLPSGQAITDTQISEVSSALKEVTG
jgi:perosamine synthetase